MGLLSAFRTRSPQPALKGERVYLRSPVIADYEEWCSLRLESRSFLTPWEAEWAADDHILSTFKRRLERYDEMRENGTHHAYFIFRGSDSKQLGAITLSNLRRGIAQMANLGYWIGEAHARQGYMTDAVQTICRHGFEDLGLHRIEAACLPANIASSRLLERCGFAREGYAREYLKIAGRWEDHYLYARLRHVHI